MKEFIQISVNQLKELKFFLFVPLGIMLLSYFIFFIDKEAFHILNYEDGLIENLTAIFLLATSLFFLQIFFMTKRAIKLLLCVLFFFGFAEEISWGQRILNFNTPESIMNVNRQDEFNIHNLDIFSPTDDIGNPKPILVRHINPGAVFLLFGFSYSLLYPFLYNSVGVVRRTGKSIGLLAPPLLFGLLFLVNYLIYKFVYSLSTGRNVRVGESFELNAVLMFASLTLYFVMNLKAAAEPVRRS